MWDEDNIPVGYQEIGTHLVWDVKFGSLQRKARLVAQGNKTEDPNVQTYASVVSRDTVRIALTIAALNELDAMQADIRNAYLNAPCDEKIWTVLGPEFGPLAGKRALIVRALYGLKSAAASHRNHLAAGLEHIGFKSCLGDPDLWYRPNTCPDNREVYEYVLVYTDDLLVLALNPKEILRKIDKYFTLKPESITEPNIYLGAKIRKVRIDDECYAWSQSSGNYVKEAIKTVETWCSGHGFRLPSKVKTALSPTYRPELDVSEVLASDAASWYRSAIGILRWSCELGRVDISTETSMLASHMSEPRIGHLMAILQVFAYLKQHHNARLVHDPRDPLIDQSKFSRENWCGFYGNVQEAIPPNAPKPRGRSIVITIWVDADHAGDKLSRRSRTGYFLFIQRSMIIAKSKKQTSVEGATFGSEFSAMKTAAEENRALRYKLRMMGVSIDGPSYMYSDNTSVLHNTSNPESTLKKKSNSIAYHFIREAVAMGEVLTGYVKGTKNLADMLTKVLPYASHRQDIIREVLWDIYSLSLKS